MFMRLKTCTPSNANKECIVYGACVRARKQGGLIWNDLRIITRRGDLGGQCTGTGRSEIKP